MDLTKIESFKIIPIKKLIPKIDFNQVKYNVVKPYRKIMEFMNEFI
jgi:hypothetical protein